jgi:4-aminobutyrate aminotransferase / (S)-3-amino-2-methylpropionate transaminase / 5-aminovalerate transaminase
MSSINLRTEIPGPNSRALVARREAATPRGAAKATTIAVERAEGAVVTDVDGNTLLDFAGGIGALAVGHCPPNVVQALRDQAEKLIHLCAIVGTYEPYVRVAELLNEVAPGASPKKTILLNSGAEAIETAVKIARSYTKRSALIVFEGAYHGRTNLTLAMTSKYGLFKKGFGPFAPEVYRLSFPYTYRRLSGISEEEYIEDAIARLENAFIAQVDPEAVAAVVIEPVQGEGGFIPAPPRFLDRIRHCHDRRRSAVRLWAHRTLVRHRALRHCARLDSHGEITGGGNAVGSSDRTGGHDGCASPGRAGRHLQRQSTGVCSSHRGDPDDSPA